MHIEPIKDIKVKMRIAPALKSPQHSTIEEAEWIDFVRVEEGDYKQQRNMLIDTTKTKPLVIDISKQECDNFSDMAKPTPHVIAEKD